MDEYDELLKELNREADKGKRAKELKKFFRGKKWNKKQRKLLEEQMKPPLQINIIKSAQEIQGDHIREEMGLTDTEGLTLTAENMKRLINDLTNSKHCRCGCGGVLLNGTFYEDFGHFSSALIKKYFTKE